MRNIAVCPHRQWTPVRHHINTTLGTAESIDALPAERFGQYAGLVRHILPLFAELTRRVKESRACDGRRKSPTLPPEKVIASGSWLLDPTRVVFIFHFFAPPAMRRRFYSVQCRSFVRMTFFERIYHQRCSSPMGTYPR